VIIKIVEEWEKVLEPACGIQTLGIAVAVSVIFSVMDDNGDEYLEGYMEQGDIPTFIIYGVSNSLISCNSR